MSSTHSSDEPVRPHLAWRWLATLAILVNIGVSYYSNAGRLGGLTMSEVSFKYPTPLTPAEYAFSIWGLIFLGLVVYGVWQLLPAQRNNPLPDAIAKPLALANLGAAAWVVLFTHEYMKASVGIMLVILVSLMVTYGTARDLIRRTAVAPRWVSIPFALFLGWISVATVLNVTIALQAAGIMLSSSITGVLAYMLMAFLVILMLILARVFQERALPLVAAWALGAIWAARIGEQSDFAWVALGAAVLVAILGLVLAQQGRKLQPWEVSSAAAAAAEAAARAKS